MNPRDLLLCRRTRRGLEIALDGGGGDDDPAAGLVNLFDLWMVFAIAVLITSVGVTRAALQTVAAEREALEDRLVPTGQTLEGRGERLGVAYRLASGEVVYVPERSAED